MFLLSGGPGISFWRRLCVVHAGEQVRTKEDLSGLGFRVAHGSVIAAMPMDSQKTAKGSLHPKIQNECAFYICVFLG